MIAYKGGENSHAGAFRVMTKRSDSERRTEAAVDALVAHVLDCADLLRRILDHMQRYHAAGLSDPDGPPVEVVIQEIVMGVVMPVAVRRPAAELELASRVVEEFTKTISREILLVPVDSPDLNGAGADEEVD
jgi:hypothetical protein